MYIYEIVDMTTESSEKMFNELTCHIGTSNWLKESMATMKERDVCDALHDAEMLLVYLNKKYIEMND